MHRLLALLPCLILVQLVTQSPLVWERRRDIANGRDSLSAVVAVEDTAVVAGTNLVPAAPTLAVLSYSGSGDELWIDSTPLMATLTTGYAAATGENVFVAGYTNVANDSDIFVKAYNATTGVILWYDVFSKGRDDLPRGISASPAAVVVIGQGGNLLLPPSTSLKGLVRAYDPITGRVLWEDLFDEGDSTNVVSQAVFVSGDQAYVAASGSDLGTTMTLRAYRASTGTLLWEVRRPGVPASISARGGPVFVAGDASLNAFIAAFHAKTGLLIWEDSPTRGHFNNVAAQRQRVVVIGSTQEGSMVRAYTAGGNVLWQHITPSGPFSGQFLSALALSPDVAYVSGAVTGFGGGEILMQAFDLTNGSLLFEDRSHGGRFSSGGAISVGKSLVFAGGTASDGDSIDLLVRAYDRAAIETQGEPSSVLEPNVTLDPLR